MTLLSPSPHRELDELEREEFTRLKVLKRKKEEAAKLASKIEAEAKLTESVEELKITTIADEPKKKGGKKKNKKSADNALSGFDAADDDEVVFK